MQFQRHRQEEQSLYQMYARKLTGKIVPKVSKPIIDFSIEKASKSLDGSRRRLKRDYLDIFLLHEPEVDLLNIDEWIGWLDRQVHKGNIREYGIAGNLIRIKEVLLTNKNLTSIVQTECSLGQDTKLEAQIRSKAKYQFRYGCIRSIGSKDIAQTLGRMANDQFKKTYLISTRKKQHLEELGRALNGT